MAPTLWSASDFKKKIATHEGMKGVGLREADVDGKLKIIHDAIKKKDWRVVDRNLRTTRMALETYTTGCKATIKLVRMQKTDKKRLKIVDKWEKAVKDFDKNLRDYQFAFRAMSDLIYQLDLQGKQVRTDIQEMTQILRGKPLDDATVTRQLSLIFRGSIAQLDATLVKLVAIDKSWNTQRKTWQNLKTLQAKTYNTKQVLQVFKVIRATLKALEI
ncbi:MAG: hypothetical protein AAF442_08635 [Pseudomonadota bacterium]